MTELLEAAERLAGAVDRLEAAVQSRRGATQALAAELASARADAAGMAGLTGTVAERLDAAIERIAHVLEANILEAR